MSEPLSNERLDAICLGDMNDLPHTYAEVVMMARELSRYRNRIERCKVTSERLKQIIVDRESAELVSMALELRTLRTREEKRRQDAAEYAEFCRQNPY